MNPGINDRFDMGMNVICIKPHGKLKVGGHYRINGCGNLENNMDHRRGNKTGYGLSVKYEEYDWKTNDAYYFTYYFTYDEMSEYFITEDDDYKAYLRDQKIEQIINYENCISSTR